MTSRAIRTGGAVLTVLLAASACTFGDPPPDENGEPPDLPSASEDSEDQAEPSVMAEVIAEDMEVPWGFTFLPDDSALVTERDTGKIMQVTPSEEEGEPAQVEEFATVDDVKPSGEGGLLGIAASPDYEDDQTVFVYYTTSSDNRIVALADGEDPEPIVEDIPHAENHNGGALAFGPDGDLYATTGDAGDADTAQDTDSLGGKILRMTPEGEPAEGNPSDDSLAYAWGLRNSEGLAWDGNDQLFATEFGDESADEINKIEAGENYGWPEVEGEGGGDDYVDPIVTWEPSEASCAGAAIADQSMVTACLRGERLWTMELTEKGTLDGEPTESLTGELGRLRGVVAAPDGSLWISTSNRDGRGEPRDGDDQIVRVIAGGSAEGMS